MNYLAHLYLSGNNEKIIVGNFIGDFVKGRQWEKYNPEIARGILLHRQIDTFTDKHHKINESKQYFKPGFGRYSGIIIDFLFDHYLAKNWGDYSDISLRQFSEKAHSVLVKNFLRLPGQVQQFLPFLIKNRRLESYAKIDGILESVGIMSKYSTLPSRPEILKEIWMNNYLALEENFTAFIPELIGFSKEFLENTDIK